MGRLQRVAGPLQLGVGTAGVAGAVVLLAPKLGALLAGGTLASGVPLAANLALLGGSVMFLREGWRRLRARTSQASPVDGTGA